MTFTVRKVSGGASSVDYATIAQTALGGSDFTPAAGTLNFASNETEKTVTVTIADETDVESDETFAFTLSNPSTGGVLASPATALATILNDDFLLADGPLVTRIAPGGLPAFGGSLTVNLTGPSAAQWRIAGDFFWHDSGFTLAGLAADAFYEIEFRPVPGYLAAPPITVAGAAGGTEIREAEYLLADPTATGSLTLNLLPESVTASRWRREGTTIWRQSGETESGLAPGTYRVEFQPVAGRATPRKRDVKVDADGEARAEAYYIAAITAVGAQPQPIAFPAPGGTDPLVFCGQLITPHGASSGVAVQTHVVLTAAHALFDDEQLTYAPPRKVRWFPARSRGTYEPEPLTPRGWQVLSGYATQRETDQSPGVPSEASQQLDVAAMYFAEPCGYSGRSGYLTGTQSPSEWLASHQDKFLVGYPIDGIPDAQLGVLAATTPMDATFTQLAGPVFTTGDFSATGGVSGGPVFVSHPDGHSYPAGIYLGVGGTGQALVRVIDSDAAELIRRAERAGTGGENQTGSNGISNVNNPITDLTLNLGKLTVFLSPNSALAGGAQWRVRDQGSTYSLNGKTRALAAGTYTIEVTPVPGLVAPEEDPLRIDAPLVPV